MPPYTVTSLSLFYYNVKFRQNLGVTWINTVVKITYKKKKSTSFPMERLPNKQTAQKRLIIERNSHL